jgi:hypothetical protein
MRFLSLLLFVVAFVASSASQAGTISVSDGNGVGAGANDIVVSNVSSLNNADLFSGLPWNQPNQLGFCSCSILIQVPPLEQLVLLPSLSTEVRLIPAISTVPAPSSLLLLFSALMFGVKSKRCRE